MKRPNACLVRNMLTFACLGVLCVACTGDAGGRASWSSSLSQFVSVIGDLARVTSPPDGSKMQSRVRDLYVFTDGAGYVVDCRPQTNTLQHKANDLFAGRRFTWQVPVAEEGWADSSKSVVLYTVDMSRVVPETARDPNMLWMKIRARGNAVTSEKSVGLAGSLGRPHLGASNEPTLGGVCVVHFPDNKPGKYCILVVVD